MQPRLAHDFYRAAKFKDQRLAGLRHGEGGGVCNDQAQHNAHACGRPANFPAGHGVASGLLSGGFSAGSGRYGTAPWPSTITLFMPARMSSIVSR